MAATYISQYGRTLIDAIFHEQDQKLIQSLRERLEKLDRREQFARLCDIHDDALLDHLMKLDMQPEAVATLAVVPLVTVAWADRTIHPKERDAVIRAAEASGISPQDGRYPILEHWLTETPAAEILEAWKLYIKAICAQLDKEEVDALKHDLLDRAQEVAEAAGGILGLGNKVSRSERAVLDELAEAFVTPPCE